MIILVPSYSQLYKKSNYSMDIDYMCNSIIEYDIKTAGLSVIKEYGLLSQDRIHKLEAIENKYDRNVAIGWIERGDKTLSRLKKLRICDEREHLFQSNNIKDEEVLSIRNDAVFIIGRQLKETKFGNHIEFVPKRRYTSFLRLNKIEYLYNRREDSIDIKGVSDNIVSYHNEGILVVIKTIMKYLEYGRIEELKSYLLDTVMKYRKRELPVSYYREFNNRNAYPYINSVQDYTFYMDNVETLEDVNISYNYNLILLPLVHKFLFWK